MKDHRGRYPKQNQMLQLLSALKPNMKDQPGRRTGKGSTGDSKNDNKCLTKAGIQHLPATLLAPVFKAPAIF